MSGLIQCGCGCGTEFTALDKKGRPRRFLPGHHSRLANPGLDKANSMPKKPVGTYWRTDGTHWRTSRARARSLVDTSSCAWEHIGGCKGPIDAAHVDGDHTNGSLTNLLPLCHSHHALLDRGRIDPTNPIMPPFYVDRSGKRRYPKKTPKKD